MSSGNRFAQLARPSSSSSSAAAPPHLRVRNAVQRQRQLDVLADRQGRYEVERLKHEAEALPPPARPFGLGQHRKVGAVDAHAACVGRLEAADQAEQRRLAGAAATHDGNELPALHGQAGAVEHGLLPVALADVVELDPCRCDGVHKSILRRRRCFVVMSSLTQFPQPPADLCQEETMAAGEAAAIVDRGDDEKGPGLITPELRKKIESCHSLPSPPELRRRSSSSPTTRRSTSRASPTSSPSIRPLPPRSCASPTRRCTRASARPRISSRR